MRRWLRDNGLTIALVTFFTVSLAGQAATGWSAENQERAEHGLAALNLASYLGSGQFLSALFENWESEFLQMWVYVMLTAYLFQRGSPESNDPDEEAPQDRDPALDARNPMAPWPVRRGGLAAKLYAHSLGAALLALFLASFAVHWLNSARAQAEEALEHGSAPPTLLQHLTEAQFWFESFQNWQSEFLSTAALILLAIVLRERGSPESKPVGAPNSETGTG